MIKQRIQLLFCIPIDRWELRDRIVANILPTERSDFVASYETQIEEGPVREAAISASFDRRYSPQVATPLARLAAHAASNGVHVVRRAGLAELRKAAITSDVVILVSHWKGPEFSNADFLSGLEGNFKRYLESTTSPLGRWLIDRTEPRPWFLRPFSKALTVPDALRLSLEADFADQPLVDGVAAYFEMPSTRAARRREWLDVYLKGLIRPGNRLELFDGLHSREVVGSALEGFSGILDLTTCTSTYLGDWLNNHWNGSFRTVQFPTVQEPTDTAARLESVINLLIDGCEYLSARRKIAEIYESEVDEYLANLQ